MAIVRTMTVGTAAVNIDDSCYRDASAEEIERRWAAVDRAIWAINRNHQQRTAKARGGASHDTEESNRHPDPRG